MDALVHRAPEAVWSGGAMLRWAQGVARRLDPDRTRDDDGAAPLGDDDGGPIGKKPSPPRAPAPTLRAHGRAATRAPKESCATLSAIISAALSATSPLASLPPSPSLSHTHNSYLVHYISFPSLVPMPSLPRHSLTQLASASPLSQTPTCTTSMSPAERTAAPPKAAAAAAATPLPAGVLVDRAVRRLTAAARRRSSHRLP